MKAVPKPGLCLLTSLTVILSVVAGVQVASPAVAGAKRPNFVFILSDDQGWQHTSVEMMKGHPESRSDYHHTPNLEVLAREGMRFSNGYAPAGVCAPSRYSIQFGQTPARLRMTKVGSPTGHIDHTMLSIPKMLKAVDPSYRAAHYGKFHLNVDPSVLGYDDSDGQTKNIDGGSFQVAKDPWGDNVADDPKQIFRITAKGNAFMEEQVKAGRPFYLQLSHYATHDDIFSRRETLAKYQGLPKGAIHHSAGMAAMTEDLDTGLGRTLAKIKELGIEDHTYIIYMADNGGVASIPFRKEYKVGYNFPLSRGKWDILEGGVRVPFIIVGPGIAPDSQCDVPVIGYDLLPTLAALVGYGRPLPSNLDGGSLVGLLEHDGHGAVDRLCEGLVFHSPHLHGRALGPFPSAIRIGDYKLVVFHAPDGNRRLLFDVAVDAGENVNIAEMLPNMADTMEQKLNAYLTDAGADTDYHSVEQEASSPE